MALSSPALNSEPPPNVEAVLPLIRSSFYRASEAKPDGTIESAFEHHFQATGSLTRPRLAVEASKCLGLDCRDAASLAACVEALHNASLIQDDYQDDAASRRGQACVASKFGGDVAISLSSRLITTAFVCLSNFSETRRLPDLIRILHSAVADTIDGQTKDLSQGEGGSLESRLDTATRKSGPLFALALRLPLHAVELNDYDRTAAEAASLFGLGYQILDDLKDQHADLESACGTNLVLSLGSGEKDSPPAVRKACQLARNALLDSSRKAAALPLGCGRGLTDLVERALGRLGAFDA